MNNTPLAVEAANDFLTAVKELDMVMAAYQAPQEELFSRYCNKNEKEKEAFVLALIGRVIMDKKRA